MLSKRMFVFMVSTFLMISLGIAGPVVSMDKKVHDFGDIHEGDVVSTIFTLENTGDTPLLINDVVAPCGCTIPEFPHEPILPGEKREIKVTFKSEGKVGVQRKAIKIVANTEKTTVFQIIANVMPKE